MSIKDFALGMIMRNPNIANNPNAREFVNVIQSGDSKRGSEIAQNICDTYGISREDAIEQAKRLFNIR